MDPDYKTQPNMQGVYGPTPPADLQQPSFQSPKPLKSSKRKFVIMAAVLFVTVGVLVVLFNLPDGKKKPSTQTQDSTETHTDAEGPLPATAVTTEQDNNAVSQEIGNLNDDQDFPTDQLSDDNLGL
jgi:hypothetical protein